MRCASCKCLIASGAQAAKMVVAYLQEDGRTTLHGYQMPDGPIATATGRIAQAWHAKCFHIQRKRRERGGDEVTGRILAGGPTGYQPNDTTALAAPLAQLRELATAMGKAVGDLAVAEAWRAQQAGGPYRHTHDPASPLSAYQLLAHLAYAHGAQPSRLPEMVHIALHAQVGALAARADDPGHTTDTERDWREQLVLDIDTITED